MIPKISNGLSSMGGVQTHQDHFHAAIRINPRQDAPFLHIEGVPQEFEGDGTAQTDQRTPHDLPLEPPSRHSIWDETILRPPPLFHRVPSLPQDSGASSAGPPPLPPPLPPAAPAQRDADVEGSGQACFVCEDAAADAVLIECGHGGLCAGEAP